MSPRISDRGHRRGGHTDLPGSVDAVIADSFAGLRQSPSREPLLDPGVALKDYQDWARRSLETVRGGALVLRGAGSPIGVATCVARRDGISHWRSCSRAGTSAVRTGMAA